MDPQILKQMESRQAFRRKLMAPSGPIRILLFRNSDYSDRLLAWGYDDDVLLFEPFFFQNFR
jgi:hypothetical protein